MEKSSETTGLSAPATVTYGYLVTNTGNVTLTGISLSDDNDEDDLSCPFTSLVPAGTMECTATHSFTQAELDAGGTLKNIVTASSNEAPDATDDLSIPITRNPALTVEKSSTTSGLSRPATVTYGYLVTNTGNVTLTGISLSDDNDEDDLSCPFTSLVPAGTMECTATHNFTQAELDAGGTLDNIVTASSNEAPDATDDLSIPITRNPALTVEKSSETTGLSAPATVTYELPGDQYRQRDPDGHQPVGRQRRRRSELPVHEPGTSGDDGVHRDAQLHPGGTGCGRNAGQHRDG